MDRFGRVSGNGGILLGKFFLASGGGGFLRGLFVNILTVAIGVLLSKYDPVLAGVFVITALLSVGLTLIIQKRFPLYYFVAVIFFHGLANLIFFTMVPRSIPSAKESDAKP